jgi:hypothetical protein
MHKVLSNTSCCSVHDDISRNHCARVLPTSPEDGLIECVPSMALARVVAEHKSVHRYWALYNADPSGSSILGKHLDAWFRAHKLFAEDIRGPDCAPLPAALQSFTCCTGHMAC